MWPLANNADGGEHTSSNPSSSSCAFFYSVDWTYKLYVVYTQFTFLSLIGRIFLKVCIYVCAFLQACGSIHVHPYYKFIATVLWTNFALVFAFIHNLDNSIIHSSFFLLFCDTFFVLLSFKQSYMTRWENKVISQTENRTCEYWHCSPSSHKPSCILPTNPRENGEKFFFLLLPCKLQVIVWTPTAQQIICLQFC